MISSFIVSRLHPLMFPALSHAHITCKLHCLLVCVRVSLQLRDLFVLKLDTACDTYDKLLVRSKPKGATTDDNCHSNTAGDAAKMSISTSSQSSSDNEHDDDDDDDVFEPDKKSSKTPDQKSKGCDTTAKNGKANAGSTADENAHADGGDRKAADAGENDDDDDDHDDGDDDETEAASKKSGWPPYTGSCSIVKCTPFLSRYGYSIRCSTT